MVVAVVLYDPWIVFAVFVVSHASSETCFVSYLERAVETLIPCSHLDSRLCEQSLSHGP